MGAKCKLETLLSSHETLFFMIEKCCTRDNKENAQNHVVRPSFMSPDALWDWSDMGKYISYQHSHIKARFTLSNY